MLPVLQHSPRCVNAYKLFGGQLCTWDRGIKHRKSELWHPKDMSPWESQSIWGSVSYICKLEEIIIRPTSWDFFFKDGTRQHEYVCLIGSRCSRKVRFKSHIVQMVHIPFSRTHRYICSWMLQWQPESRPPKLHPTPQVHDWFVQPLPRHYVCPLCDNFFILRTRALDEITFTFLPIRSSKFLL